MQKKRYSRSEQMLTFTLFMEHSLTRILCSWFFTFLPRCLLYVGYSTLPKPVHLKASLISPLSSTIINIKGRISAFVRSKLALYKSLPVDGKDCSSSRCKREHEKKIFNVYRMVEICCILVYGKMYVLCYKNRHFVFILTNRWRFASEDWQQ